MSSMSNMFKFVINTKQFIIIILCFPLLFFVYYQFQIVRFMKGSEIILDKLEHTLSENQELLKFIGERIMVSDNPSLENINELLKGTNVLVLSHLMGAYISWADKSGVIGVSGKKGILRLDRPTISHRRYYKEGLKEPWKLHISPVEQSVFSTNYVVPTAMSVSNKKGEVVGFLVLGLRLKFLEKIIDQELKGLDWGFAYLNNDLIFGSTGFTKDFEWSSLSFFTNGNFVIKTGVNFTIKVAVGLGTIQLLTAFIKLYFLGVLAYYIVAYLIFIFIVPKIKRYSMKENDIFLTNLALAITSEDKVNNLKNLLFNEQENTKDVIIFILSVLEHNVELDNKLSILQTLHSSFIKSIRIKNKYIDKIGLVTGQYLERLKENIVILYDNISDEEDLTILNKILGDIQELENGNLSYHEQTFCSVAEYINQALAINSYFIHEKELEIDCVFDESPEIYIDPLRLESGLIAVIKYCIDNSLRSKTLKIRTKNIISNSSKIQIIFEVGVVVMTSEEKLALEQLLNISGNYNVLNPFHKTYEQIEKTFELLDGKIQSSDFGAGMLKIIINLDLASNTKIHKNISSKNKIVTLQRVK